MLVRRLLEIALFLFYWIGFAYGAGYVFYWYIVDPHKWQYNNPAMAWSALAVFIFILVIIYLVVRYLVLLIYTRVKLHETRLIAKTKQQVRLIKENSKKSSSLGGSTNVNLENQENAEKEALNNNPFKRFLSLNNITNPLSGTIMKNGKSLDTALDIEAAPQPPPKPSQSLAQLIDIYEKPQHKQNVNNHSDKLQKYAITSSSGKIPAQHSKSMENLLDDDKAEGCNQSASTGNLYNCYENAYDIVDGANTLRKAPAIPSTLPRMPKQKKRLAPAPPAQLATNTVPRIHQQSRMATKPPLPPLPPNNKQPVLLKNVLVSNAKNFNTTTGSRNLRSNV